MLSADFKQLGGVLRIKIDKFPESSEDYFLTVTADKPICGDFEVNLESGTPIIESSDSPDSSNPGNNTVTIHFSGVKEQSGVFYIPLPECQFEPTADDKYNGGYKMTVELGYIDTADGKKYSSCTAKKSLEVVRGHYKKVNITQRTMYKDGYEIIAGHKFIDLDLPNGNLWAETNVGATLPADYGNYYAWGETETKSSYYPDAYNYFDKYDSDDSNKIYYKKYCSGSDMWTLVTSDDAAYTNWSTKCWTPTIAQVQELIDNTTYSRTSRQNSNGKSIGGFEFTSKTNGNSIFLPYNGEYFSSSVRWHSGYNGAHYGYYWTNNLVPEVKDNYWVWKNYAYDVPSCLVFGDDVIDSATNADVLVKSGSKDGQKRYYGLGVRPIANAN